MHDDYQSFFPTDVHVVADHAKRAITAFPAADRPYYGIDYPARRLRTPESRPDADRIDWYRNIPVPTSYMCVGTAGRLLRRLRPRRRRRLRALGRPSGRARQEAVDLGQRPFGRAWDANLTDADGPYVELMAGVVTDNQPDFAFLAPGETKTFSQYWYPIQEIGPVHQASPEAASGSRGPPPTTDAGVAVACRARLASGPVVHAMLPAPAGDAPVASRRATRAGRRYRAASSSDAGPRT